MHQLWVPGWQPRLLSREYLARCIRTTAGGHHEKSHYLALALYAATREGIADEGEVVVRTDVLGAALEHPPQSQSLRRHLTALERSALIEISRAGRARRYRVRALPDDRIVLGSQAALSSGIGLESAIEADQISYALSRAVTGAWQLKTLLLALGALWRAAGNDRGSVRVGRAQLRAILEWSHQGRLATAKGALRDAGYIDWAEYGEQVEIAFLVDAYGDPRPEWRERNRVILDSTSARAAPEPHADPAREPAEHIGIVRDEDAPPRHQGPPEVGGPAMSPRQLRTLAGILRDLYSIPHGEPVEQMALITLPEDLAAQMARQAGGPKRAAGDDAQISLDTIPGDIGAELIRRLGGPARNDTERRLRTRWLRDRMRSENRSGQGGEKPHAPSGDTDPALEAGRRERAEQSARQLGYVPTDNPDEPWVRKTLAPMLGYEIRDGRARKRRAAEGGRTEG